jgi:hypothetical protein
MESDLEGCRRNRLQIAEYRVGSMLNWMSSFVK